MTKSNPFSSLMWRKLSALLLAIALFTSPAFGQGAAVAPKPVATLTAAEKEAPRAFVSRPLKK